MAVQDVSQEDVPDATQITLTLGKSVQHQVVTLVGMKPGEDIDSRRARWHRENESDEIVDNMAGYVLGPGDEFSFNNHIDRVRYTVNSVSADVTDKADRVRMTKDTKVIVQQRQLIVP